MHPNQGFQRAEDYPLAPSKMSNQCQLFYFYPSSIPLFLTSLLLNRPKLYIRSQTKQNLEKYCILTTLNQEDLYVPTFSVFLIL